MIGTYKYISFLLYLLYLIVQNIERNQNENPDFYNMDAISPLPSSWKSEDNKSGTLIYRMAQQTRPRMKTNNENIDITSKGIRCTKFKKDLNKGGKCPYILYHILINAESTNYSDVHILYLMLVNAKCYEN